MYEYIGTYLILGSTTQSGGKIGRDTEAIGRDLAQQRRAVTKARNLVIAVPVPALNSGVLLKSRGKLHANVVLG